VLKEHLSCRWRLCVTMVHISEVLKGVSVASWGRRIGVGERMRAHIAVLLGHVFLKALLGMLVFELP